MNFSVSNDLDEFGHIAEAAGEFIDAHQLEEAAAFKLRLVLDEVVSNIIRYAYDDKAAHTIDIAMNLDGADVVISVEDDGRPFDPSHARSAPHPDSLDDAPTGGRGIFLLHELTDDVSYERRAGRNRVTVRFGSTDSQPS